MASPARKAFLLRLDPAVWESIEQLAAQELRSVNGQIEWLLRESLRRRGRQPQRPDPADATGDAASDATGARGRPAR